MLCRIVEPLKTTPFIIGVYGGMQKPTDASDYLSDAIIEFKRSVVEGLRIGERCVSIKLTAVICDKPARSFVQQGMSHTGYSGCDKCLQRGRYVKQRMTFPRIGSRLRTDRGVRGSRRTSRSPFESIPVHMIQCFPIDYMHAVCLGVVRRIIKLWHARDVDHAS